MVVSMLLVTLTRRWENFPISTRSTVASRRKAYHATPLGTSALCLLMEKKQPCTFHSWGVGAPLRSLAAEEHLSKKQGAVFIKPSFNRSLPCALHCSRKFRSPRSVQVVPDLQTFSRTVAASHACSWTPLSLPGSPLPCPCLLLVQQPGPLCGLRLGVALYLTNCCVFSTEPAGSAGVCSRGPQTWWHRDFT